MPGGFELWFFCQGSSHRTPEGYCNNFYPPSGERWPILKRGRSRTPTYDFLIGAPYSKNQARRDADTVLEVNGYCDKCFRKHFPAEIGQEMCKTQGWVHNRFLYLKLKDPHSQCFKDSASYMFYWWAPKDKSRELLYTGEMMGDFQACKSIAPTTIGVA